MGRVVVVAQPCPQESVFVGKLHGGGGNPGVGPVSLFQPLPVQEVQAIDDGQRERADRAGRCRQSNGKSVSASSLRATDSA
jgi:hypothetical protein